MKKLTDQEQNDQFKTDNPDLADLLKPRDASIGEEYLKVIDAKKPIRKLNGRKNIEVPILQERYFKKEPTNWGKYDDGLADLLKTLTNNS